MEPSVSFKSCPPHVICLGEALVDRLGPLGGDPVIDKPVVDCFGGAPANVACGLANLGIPVAFVGRLGDDEIGQNFMHLMLRRGVKLEGCQLDSSRPTRVVLVKRDFDGERVFQGFLGNQGQGFADQALRIDELIDSWALIAQQAKWLIIGSIPLASKASSEALLWVIQKAIDSGIHIALDVNWRPTFWEQKFFPDSPPDEASSQAIANLFHQASLLKLAREEAIWFFKTDDPSKISSSLPKAPDVVVTDGARPIRWIIDGFMGQLNALSPNVVIDTTGAGDAFTAGLIHQLLNVSSSKLDLEKVCEMVQFAAACGALVCSGSGAIDPQPKKFEVQEFVASISSPES